MTQFCEQDWGKTKVAGLGQGGWGYTVHPSAVEEGAKGDFAGCGGSESDLEITTFVVVPEVAIQGNPPFP